MFRNYTTIDEVMTGPGNNLVIETLNLNPMYCRAVSQMGFRKIGIVVTDSKGIEISRYVSSNKPSGEIFKIANEFELCQPDIVVRVKDTTLMEILHNIEDIKNHPYSSFFRFASSFSPGRNKDILNLGVKLPSVISKWFFFRNKCPEDYVLRE